MDTDTSAHAQLLPPALVIADSTQSLEDHVRFSTSNFFISWNNPLLNIYHMLGLSGTSSYVVFVYLCLCICVFVYETLGDISQCAADSGGRRRVRPTLAGLPPPSTSLNPTQLRKILSPVIAHPPSCY